MVVDWSEGLVMLFCSFVVLVVCLFPFGAMRKER
jgi:hypothetical protein